MNISQVLDATADRLETINWKKVTKDVIKIWDILWKFIVITMILTYVAGEALGTWIHQTNDILAANWVRLIVPSNSVETEQAPIVEQVSITPPAVEVELMLPPAPLVVEDPWDDPEVELKLPLALEPMAILFTAPLALTTAKAPVALLAAGQVAHTPTTNVRRKRGRRATQKK